MDGVNARTVGSPLTRTGALQVRPRSVLCTSWIWLYSPPVKSDPSYAMYNSPVRGSIAGNGRPNPVRNGCPVFGLTGRTLVSCATTVGALHVAPPSVDRTTSNRANSTAVPVASVYWMDS